MYTTHATFRLQIAENKTRFIAWQELENTKPTRPTRQIRNRLSSSSSRARRRVSFERHNYSYALRLEILLKRFTGSEAGPTPQVDHACVCVCVQMWARVVDQKRKTESPSEFNRACAHTRARIIAITNRINTSSSEARAHAQRMTTMTAIHGREWSKFLAW